MDIIKKGVYFLIPGKIEELIDYANDHSNLAYYGVYSNIQENRNLLYATSIFSVFLYLSGYKSFGSVCFFAQLGIYFYIIKRWNQYI